MSIGKDEISRSLKQAEEDQKAMKNASLSLKEKKKVFQEEKDL